MTTIDGQTLAAWLARHPLIGDLMALKEVAWFNPAVRPAAEALPDVGLTEADVDEAADRLQRFAPYLARVFPETAAAGGIIESPVRPIPDFQAAIEARERAKIPGRMSLKLDSHLPISGSIKARGGIHEVLSHAEDLAVEAGLIRRTDDYAKLDSDAARAFFGRYRLAVGSTGNLGLSIGIMGRALGFEVIVHMSSDARAWKKAKLRAHGVTVVEHAADYSAAVAEGRRLAAADPACHFIDDENSMSLFLGYAVAGRRLKAQLAAAGVAVDAGRPLFAYLPCGVGGGPGGVAFGLKLAFGDAVHCVFVEPTHAPAMLIGVLTGLHDRVSVQDFGIDGVTAADGLAVGRPSGFVGRAMARLIDGYVTVADETLFAQLALLHAREGVGLEPSAAAGLPGPWRVSAPEAAAYRARMGLTDQAMAHATHLVWATGGSMVPEAERNADLERGREALRR